MIDIETPMWNPPESEYILVDDYDHAIEHKFKARGAKAALAEQKYFDVEHQMTTTMYVKVAGQ